MLGYVGSGYQVDILPIIPPAVALGEGCTVRLEDRGKVPGKREPGGVWYGYPKWQETAATAEDLALWASWGASTGLQARRYPGIDIDVSDGAFAYEIEALAVIFLGLTPARERSGSSRRLLVYENADQREPARKRRLAFTLPGSAEKHAVEILGAGQQYLIHGLHKSGSSYSWRDGRDLLVYGGLTPIVSDDIRSFLGAVEMAVIGAGGEVEVKSGKSLSLGPAGVRLTLPHPSHGAKDLLTLHEALHAIPVAALDYDEWVALTAAYKAACGGSEAFFEDSYLPWALGYAGNDEEICRKKWESITDSAVGADYVYRVARGHGWVGTDEFAPIPDEIIGPGGVRREAVPDVDHETFIDRYAYLTLLDRYVDLAYPETLLRGPQLSNILAQHVGDVASSTQNAAVLLQKNPRAQKYAQLTYRPGAERLVYEPRYGTCVNSWSASALRMPRHSTTKEVKPWLDHVEYLIPDARERGLLLDWLAYKIQSPGKKANWAVLMGGIQGIGKDLMLIPVLEVVGAANVKRASQDTIQSDYSSWAANTEMVVIDEVRNFTPSVMNKLKAYITVPPDDVEIREKFQPTYSVPNVAAYFAFTNFEDALALEKADRRWFVLWSPAAPKEPAYYWKFDRWVRENAALVGAWLRERDVSAFQAQGHAPSTAAKLTMQKAAQPAFEAWVAESIEDGVAPFDTDLVVLEDVMARLPQHVRALAPTALKLAAVLRSLGAVAWSRVRLGRRLETSRSDRGGIWAVRRCEMYRPEETEKIVSLFWRQRDEAMGRGMGFSDADEATG